MPPCFGGRWRVRGDGSGGRMARAAQEEAASAVVVQYEVLGFAQPPLRDPANPQWLWYL